MVTICNRQKLQFWCKYHAVPSTKKGEEISSIHQVKMAACTASDDNAIRAQKDKSGWLRKDQFFHFKVSTKNTVNNMAQCPSCFILFLLFRHSVEWCFTTILNIHRSRASNNAYSKYIISHFKIDRTGLSFLYDNCVIQANHFYYISYILKSIFKRYTPVKIKYSIPETTYSEIFPGVKC